jgi:hypothetical protein
MAMPSQSFVDSPEGTSNPPSPGFLHFGGHQQVAVDLSALYDTASRVGAVAAMGKRAHAGNPEEEEEGEDEISAEVRSLMNQYMQRGNAGSAASNTRNSKAVTGWETDDHLQDEEDSFGYRDHTS